ncbi:MAG: pyruvate carboxylase [Neomegalonema sp.]|nr:pyruvate carboxylase [Neomegalonema sp.]
MSVPNTDSRSGFSKILIANRGEIAIRVSRAANELGKRTVAVYAEEDKLSLHRFKTDEAYLIGEGLGPIEAYLAIDSIINVAKECGADAIHPGYGFLSESPEFADACAAAGIAFIGPKAETMRLLGDKVSARRVAVEAGVPVVPATDPLPDVETPEGMAKVRELAEEVGYPVMLKASWGGGGRGMRPIRSADELEQEVLAGKREARAAFGKDDVYLEKLIERARHVEVQILGDRYGEIIHLFERDCSVQRRNQKVVERAPAPYLDEARRAELAELGLKIARKANYELAGTVEFLMDMDNGAFYFIEVNPRVQVEHTVTEEVTGVDIVKAQIRLAEGARIGDGLSGAPKQEDVRLTGHALQCRVTTEDPLNSFIPDYGRITAYRGATGFGIRLDGGTAYSGAVITRHYDSLLEKVTAWAPTPEEAIKRMTRALREFRIRGVATNLAFVENLIGHPSFQDNSYTTRFIDTHPELFEFKRRRDRATKLLNYIADITVNGHPEAKGRPRPPAHARAPKPPAPRSVEAPEGLKQLLDSKGPRAVADWMLAQKQLLLTDTTMRDGHQSLLATRMRSLDMLNVAPIYARNLPQLFSVECWGGATFDVAYRFLQECPWKRLVDLRKAMPNHLTQMLLRASNGVGYTNYPDNVVKKFTLRAAESGVDVFRIFDSLNWVENMRVAIDACLETDKICEAAICYTGDMLDPNQSKYDLKYYTDMARSLRDAGAHIIGLKDMAGLLKPAAARVLIKALKEETGLPIHLHTHDTSGVAGATLLAASEAGVDAVDAAMDSFAGMTSQPCLGSIVEALRHTDRDTGIDPTVIRELSDYWEAVRVQYAAFETDMKAPASEVYLHEMPGGQFTNLKAQARSLGLDERWHDVAQTYADVNQMFGDIPKVTPSSKVVGDMALAMVSANLTRADVEDPEKEIAFPDSVVDFLRGGLGAPPNGFPEALQKKALKGEAPIQGRPGASMAALDLEAKRAEAEAQMPGVTVDDEDLCSYLMYPKVYLDYMGRRRLYGPVRQLPTPMFFYGMEIGDQAYIDLEPGKTLVLRLLAVGETDEEGQVKVFFELNGQPRNIRVPNRAVSATTARHPKAEDGNADHVPAPMPGLIATVAVKEGQKVEKGDLLLTIEAMKMETAIHAERAGVIAKVAVAAGAQVDAKDLLVAFEG